MLSVEVDTVGKSRIVVNGDMLSVFTSSLPASVLLSIFNSVVSVIG